MNQRDPLFPVHQRSPRFATQLDIEQRITTMSPDALEFHDMLPAFTVELRRQYGDDALEACLYASLLQRALVRLNDGLQVDAKDTLKAFEDRFRSR